jgi:hypothetical protein
MPLASINGDGMPISELNQMAMRDSYATPSVTLFMPLAMADTANDIIAMSGKREPLVSKEDVERASVIVAPIVENAACRRIGCMRSKRNFRATVQTTIRSLVPNGSSTLPLPLLPTSATWPR